VKFTDSDIDNILRSLETLVQVADQQRSEILQLKADLKATTKLANESSKRMDSFRARLNQVELKLPRKYIHEDDGEDME
jgi:ABC-type transporter Mla subunit MlaD